MNDINKKVEKLELHFNNHLMHHQDLEIGYERRLGTIEGNRFTSKDGKILYSECKTMLDEYKHEHDKAYPPKWLIQQIEHLEKDVEGLCDKHKK